MFLLRKFNGTKIKTPTHLKEEALLQYRFKPLPAVRNGRPFTIKDLKSFEEFVDSTPYKRIQDLLEPFEQKFGYKISYSILWRGLSKIGRIKKQNS